MKTIKLAVSLLAVLVLAGSAQAVVTVDAWYELGEADPGSGPNLPGQSTTPPMPSSSSIDGSGICTRRSV